MAAIALGQLLEEQHDPDGARTAYQTAIDTGHPNHVPTAIVRIGQLRGASQPPDFTAARRWLEQAAEAGNAEAMLNLSPLWAVEGDVSDARSLLDRAARSGITRTADYAAVLDDDPIARKRARITLSQFAELGDTDR